MTRQDDKNRDGPTTTAYADECAKLDTLPVELSTVMKRSPLCYGVRAAVDTLKVAKNNVAAAKAALISDICRDMVGRTTKTYGEDHPQANIKAWLK